MARGKVRKNTKSQPNWLAVIIAVACIAGALWLFWQGVNAPTGGVLKVLLVILVIIVAVLVCFMAGMRLILEFYSKGVWATPEEQEMIFPGDDLVKDVDGKKPMRVRQVCDLDAPVEEVWKRIYQMDPTKCSNRPRLLQWFANGFTPS